MHLPTTAMKNGIERKNKKKKKTATKHFRVTKMNGQHSIHKTRTKRCTKERREREDTIARLPLAVKKKEKKEEKYTVCGCVCVSARALATLANCCSQSLFFHHWISKHNLQREKQTVRGCCFAWIFFFSFHSTAAGGTYINSRSSRGKHLCRTVTAVLC